jgi:hypothetical protein
MAKFITNIQLHDADKNDHNVLSGATKSTAYVAGKEVPDIKNDVTLQDVNDAVLRASSKTGRQYSFFVISHKKVA